MLESHEWTEGARAFKLELGELYEWCSWEEDGDHHEGWESTDVTKIQGELFRELLRLAEGYRADRVHFEHEGKKYKATFVEVGQSLTQNQK